MTLLFINDVLICGQDCFKVSVTGRLDPPAQGKLAGGVQSGLCIRPAEPEHCEAGIIALFFYVYMFKYTVDHFACRLSDRGCPVPDPLVIPFRDIPECRRHVFRMGGIPVLHIVREAVVGCKPFPFVVDLYSAVGHPQVYLYLLLCVLIRAGISVLVIHDMEIKVYRTVVDPFGNFLRHVRKGPEIFLFLQPDLISAPVTFLERFAVEFTELPGNAVSEGFK